MGLLVSFFTRKKNAKVHMTKEVSGKCWDLWKYQKRIGSFIERK